MNKFRTTRKKVAEGAEDAGGSGATIISTLTLLTPPRPRLNAEECELQTAGREQVAPQKRGPKIRRSTARIRGEALYTKAVLFFRDFK
jgi:hypothetical protein